MLNKKDYALPIENKYYIKIRISTEEKVSNMNKLSSDVFQKYM
jgi:hypothetical protein